MKAVDEHPDYRVNFAQFNTVGTWEACQGYGIWRFPHFRSFDCTLTYMYVNAFGTKQSVRNIVDGCFSGVSVGRDSTVYIHLEVVTTFTIKLNGFRTGV